MPNEFREVKIVPQLNHDLFSFTKAMKEGWQMNGRWKEGGLMIELYKTANKHVEKPLFMTEMICEATQKCVYCLRK